MGDAESLTDAGLTALDVLHETFQRVKATDPADIETTLLAAYEGLALTCAADHLLEETVLEVDFARFWPGENFLGPGGRQQVDLALAWLDAAPSLPHLTAQHDRVTMLAPPQVAAAMYKGQISNPITESDAKQLVLVSVNIVLVAMQSMWVQVHTLLTRAAELAGDAEDRLSCKIAALMAHELAHPEQVDRRRDINRRIMALKEDRRTRDQLVGDDQLMSLLRNAVRKAARGEDGWATLKKVVAALQRADPEWMPERWGYTTDLGLLNATREFDIRKVDRNGWKVPEVRARRSDRPRTAASS